MKGYTITLLLCCLAANACTEGNRGAQAPAGKDCRIWMFRTGAGDSVMHFSVRDVADDQSAFTFQGRDQTDMIQVPIKPGTSVYYFNADKLQELHGNFLVVSH